MASENKSGAGLFQLVIRSPVLGRSADSEWFTTGETLARANWRADKACQLLQIAKNPHFGFYPFAQEFQVLTRVDIAFTAALANPQHGPGGGQKIFIPKRRHVEALLPVGPLIPLTHDDRDDDDEQREPPQPMGPIRALAEAEVAAGGVLLLADRCSLSNGITQSRFWFQEPLHMADLAQFDLPSSVKPFHVPDMHGGSAGFVTDDAAQVIVAPPANQPRRSWFRRLFGG